MPAPLQWEGTDVAFEIIVCLDFYDDLLAAPFDRDRLRRLFELYRSWGATRLDWVDSPFLEAREKWASIGAAGTFENGRRTYENLGPILPAAIRTAHALGMRFHVVYKPFDHAFGGLFMSPHHSPHARFEALGGSVVSATRDLVRLRHMQMERHPHDLPADIESRVIAGIEFTSDRPAELDVTGLRILVSRDNGVYRRYTKPFPVEKRGERTVRLRGLSIAEPYVAVTLPGEARREAFTNTLDRLVRLYDPSGRQIPFTYGLRSRKDWVKYLSERRRRERIKADPTVSRRGYCFDVHGAFDRSLHTVRWSVDNSRGYLALARGKNRYVVGVLSPAHPEVQDLWLREIERFLDAGADAVDLRVENHAWPLEYERYGFEAPVLGACRSGRDGGFPAEAERLRVRAQQYTAFCRRAGELVRGRGKRLHAHVSHMLMGRRPGQRYMGMLWEWERWITEGIVDGVTLKDTYPFGPTEGRFRQITRLARRQGVPVFHCPNFNVISCRDNWLELMRANLAASAAAGHAGSILYESSRATRMEPDGRIRLLFPEIGGLLRSSALTPSA